MNKRTLKLFTDLLSLPTAPYREENVAYFIRAFAKRRNLPVVADKYGNLIVRYTNGDRPKPVALTAHMDHPGFEVHHGRGRDLKARWLGGCDPKHFPGSRVTIISNGEQLSGRVTSPLSDDGQKKFSIRAAKIVTDPKNAYGYWGLKPVEVDGDILRTKAADNLASCAAILAVLDRLSKQKVTADLWGVFTRAEEVGLVGAGGIVDAHTVPKRVPIIVLETSKELPGAEMGQGPVIRVGDRLSIFDPGVEYAMHNLAQTLAQNRRKFKFQRQLMDGGTCEASVYVLHGFTVGALAFPLGNYHNQSKRWPAEEYISISDADGMIELCAAIASHPPSREPRTPMRRRFENSFDRQKKRLLN
jgi:putative aminopeptidase FrvX